MEIERKFKVNYLPDLSNYPFYEITQMYLSYDLDIRIRKKGNKYFITKKSNDTIKRYEEEVEIDYQTFDILSTLSVGNIISKTRYLIPIDNSLTAEVDIYHGVLEGLVTVEVEFSSLEEANSFIAPLWFGEEITENMQYKNKELAKLNNLTQIRKL